MPERKHVVLPIHEVLHKILNPLNCVEASLSVASVVVNVLADGVIEEVPPGLSVPFPKNILDGPHTGVVAYKTIPGSVEVLQGVVCLRLVLHKGIILTP